MFDFMFDFSIAALTACFKNGRAGLTCVPQGLKTHSNCTFSARLKSCPETERIFETRSSFKPRRKAAGIALGALALLFAAHVHAQATTPVHDTSPLHPPAGAKVAIVEFEDQECPDCGAANPVLKAAATKYNIPWVRHDFPLKFHNWSHQAAVYARWFDTKSKKMGDDYRDFIFANQPSIETPAQLTQITGKFAADHGLALPFAVDPQGKLVALVDGDYALGERVGIEHTPTIWVVTAGGKAPPYIEVTDRSKLYQIIDAAIAATK